MFQPPDPVEDVERLEREDAGEEEIVRSPSAELVRELSLVLEAVGIPHRRAQVRGTQALVVAAAHADRALRELARYQRENRDWPPRRAGAPVSFRGGATAAVAYATLLLVLLRFSTARAFGIDWYDAGQSDGARIAQGEWWRALTALSLHADLVHLANNLVFGAAIGTLLTHVYGAGLAWLCFVGAGFLGNVANAWAHGFAHSSVGASTAVFGGLGALAAAQSVQKLRLGRGPLARLAPLICAALLLGLYGVGGARMEAGRGLVQDPGDRTDVGAHLLGFAAGLCSGALLALWRARGGAGPRARELAAGAALFAFPLAWSLALWKR